MPIDLKKVAELTEQYNHLEAQLKEAGAKLQEAIGQAAPINEFPVPAMGNKGNDAWGSVTDAIMEYIDGKPKFTVREVYDHLKTKGYRGDRNPINARIHKLLAGKKLKKIEAGVYKKA